MRDADEVTPKGAVSKMDKMFRVVVCGTAKIASTHRCSPHGSTSHSPRNFRVSYVDASGERVRQKVEAHTRQQALDALRRVRTKEELARTLGVCPNSEITTEALFERYKRHQKARIRSTTYEQLSPDYMPASVNKFDGIMGGMLAKMSHGSLT
jgi:hypothetical protein